MDCKWEPTLLLCQQERIFSVCCTSHLSCLKIVLFEGSRFRTKVMMEVGQSRSQRLRSITLDPKDDPCLRKHSNKLCCISQFSSRGKDVHISHKFELPITTIRKSCRLVEYRAGAEAYTPLPYTIHQPKHRPFRIFVADRKNNSKHSTVQELPKLITIAKEVRSDGRGASRGWEPTPRNHYHRTLGQGANLLHFASLLDESSKPLLRRKRLRSGKEVRGLGRHPLLTIS